ncbi:MAG: hypothetical protein F6J87_19880 [Spirulina sp. SIO3F2]|nr:hypothetical protein [Spirulina sp. SIO3F2]
MTEFSKIQNLVRAAKALLIESENAQRFDAMQCDCILDPTIAILDAVLDEVEAAAHKEASLQLLAATEAWPATPRTQMHPFDNYSQPPSQTPTHLSHQHPEVV